jgi:7,8-dihydropterin-6-yl-methyl-4-(beta-D-ribofuranosyl)aminobenzene 5'-phosphate synthase
MKLTIISENRVGLSKGLIAEHGWSVCLEAGDKKVLWDTGQGMALKGNAAALGVNLKQIDLIALSHGHYDHTGGLAAALEASGGAEVICHPACFENKKVRREMFGKTLEIPVGCPWKAAQLEAQGARLRFVEDAIELAPGVHFFAAIPMRTDFERIEPGFFVDGEHGRRDDDFADDAALAVVTERGVSVLLGCAHRGMINTLEHVRARLGVERIVSVWGGTHLIERRPEQVEATIAALSRLGVETVAAAHCTGFQNESRLATALREKFVFAHVGARAEL